MEDLYIDFTVAISRLSKIIQKIKSFEIGKYGFKSVHISCIYYLNKNADGLTAKELSALSLEDKAAISRALKTLHEQNIVEYLPRGRNETVRLTEKGKELSEVINQKIESAVKKTSISLTKEQRKFFYDSLFEISDNLTKYYNNIVKEKR